MTITYLTDHPYTLPQSKRVKRLVCLEQIQGRNAMLLTDPAVCDSWVDLPLTRNVTPLGAFDLISRLASHVSTRTRVAGIIYTGSNVIKILGKELWKLASGKIES